MAKPRTLVVRARRPDDPHVLYRPHRFPAWRYERVKQLTTRGPSGILPPFRGADDHWIRAARPFHLRWQMATADEREDLFPQNPGLCYAYEIDTNSRDLLTYIIQGRILAGQSNEAIAARIGTLPEAIDWYEKLFFNVRDRLDRKDWIVRQVLGATRHHPFDYGELSEFTLRFFGYFGGPQMLDLVVYGWTEEDRPTSLADAQHVLVRQANASIRRAALLAARSCEVNKHNALRLLEVYIKILDYELKERKELGAVQERGMEDNIRQMMEEITITVGDLAMEKHPAYARLAEFEHGAAELRDDEILRYLALGVPPAEDVKLLSIPPPAVTLDVEPTNGATAPEK